MGIITKKIAWNKTLLQSFLVSSNLFCCDMHARFKWNFYQTIKSLNILEKWNMDQITVEIIKHSYHSLHYCLWLESKVSEKDRSKSGICLLQFRTITISFFIIPWDILRPKKATKSISDQAIKKNYNPMGNTPLIITDCLYCQHYKVVFLAVLPSFL